MHVHLFLLYIHPSRIRGGIARLDSATRSQSPPRAHSKAKGKYVGSRGVRVLSAKNIDISYLDRYTKSIMVSAPIPNPSAPRQSLPPRSKQFGRNTGATSRKRSASVPQKF